MMARRCGVCAAAALLIPLALYGCGTTPAGPDPSGRTPVSLRIVLDGSETVVTIRQGDAKSLTVEERDASGRIITGAASAYTWSSDAPAVVEAGAGGVLRTGADFGHAVVGVRSSSGLTASSHVWVEPADAVRSGYRITLQFADDVPGAWRDEFVAAAARWERVIRAELPAVSLNRNPHPCATPPGEPEPPPLTGSERGTRIYVGLSGHFPPHIGRMAVGGPCLQRPLPSATSIYGQVTLNRDRVGSVTPAYREYVALHELGHTLGLVGVIQGAQPDWFDVPTGRYTGPFGLEGYRRQSGLYLPALTAPGSHWPFEGDVMGSATTRIGPATIGALMDLGYPVGWYGADR